MTSSRSTPLSPGAPHAGCVAFNYYPCGDGTVKCGCLKSSAAVTVGSASQALCTYTTLGVLAGHEEFNVLGAPDPNLWGYDIGDGSVYGLPGAGLGSTWSRARAGQK